jgi:hypothetical protein
VLEEIASYRYEVDQAATGKPPSDEWVARQIAALRAALVEPEWRVVQKRDAPAESARETPELRHCVLIAVDRDPDGYAELYFDPMRKTSWSRVAIRRRRSESVATRSDASWPAS